MCSELGSPFGGAAGGRRRDVRWIDWSDGGDDAEMYDAGEDGSAGEADESLNKKTTKKQRV